MIALGRLTLGCALVLTTAVACRPRAAAGTGGESGPRIEKISPDSVNTSQGQVIEVTLSGSGFDATENTVAVGPVTLTRLASGDDGRTLRFTVPLTMSSGGGAPPMPLRGSRFQVTVTTPRGVSNAVALAIQ
ncbi:MAG TPA: hypothetical protein VM076_11010 [Gemmatimonadaceae bacterium]|nr:hypothetical protein [Gemmatimonadaceae bacterium]